jgi:hypothetical protein
LLAHRLLSGLLARWLLSSLLIWLRPRLLID